MDQRRTIPSTEELQEKNKEFFKNSKFKEGYYYFFQFVEDLPFFEREKSDRWSRAEFDAFGHFLRYAFLTGNLNLPSEGAYGQDLIQVLDRMWDLYGNPLHAKSTFIKSYEKGSDLELERSISFCLDKYCNLLFYSGNHLKGISLGLKNLKIKEYLRAAYLDSKQSINEKEIAYKLRVNRTQIILGKNFWQHGNYYAAIFAYLEGLIEYSKFPTNQRSKIFPARAASLIAQVYLELREYRMARILLDLVDKTERELDKSQESLYKIINRILSAKAYSVKFDRHYFENHPDKEKAKEDLDKIKKQYNTASRLFENAENSFEAIKYNFDHRYRASLYSGRSNLYFQWAKLVGFEEHQLAAQLTNHEKKTSLVLAKLVKRKQEFLEKADQNCKISANIRKKTFKKINHPTIANIYNLLAEIRLESKDLSGAQIAIAGAIQSVLNSNFELDREEYYQIDPLEEPITDHFLDHLKELHSSEDPESPLYFIPRYEEFPIIRTIDDVSKYSEKGCYSPTRLLTSLYNKARIQKEILDYKRYKEPEENHESRLNQTINLIGEWFEKLDKETKRHNNTEQNDSLITGWEGYEKIYRLRIADFARDGHLLGLELMAKEYHPVSSKNPSLEDDNIFSEEEVFFHFLRTSRLKLPRSSPPLHQVQADRRSFELGKKDLALLTSNEELKSQIEDLVQNLLEAKPSSFNEEYSLESAKSSVKEDQERFQKLIQFQEDWLDNFGSLNLAENSSMLSEQTSSLKAFRESYTGGEIGCTLAFLVTNSYFFTLALYNQKERPIRLLRNELPKGRSGLRESIKKVINVLNDSFWEDNKSWIQRSKMDKYIIPEKGKSIREESKDSRRILDKLINKNSELFYELRSIYKTIWAPISSGANHESLLEGVKRVYIIPNDCLVRLPFEILFRAESENVYYQDLMKEKVKWSDLSFLVDQFDITYYLSLPSLYRHHSRDSGIEYVDQYYTPGKHHLRPLAFELHAFNVHGKMVTFQPKDEEVRPRKVQRFFSKTVKNCSYLGMGKSVETTIKSAYRQTSSKAQFNYYEKTVHSKDPFGSQTKEYFLENYLSKRPGILMLNTHSMPNPMSNGKLKDESLVLVIACQKDVVTEEMIRTIVTREDISLKVKPQENGTCHAFLSIFNSCRTGAGEINRQTDFDSLIVRLIQQGHQNILYTQYKVNTSVMSEFYEIFFRFLAEPQLAYNICSALSQTKREIKQSAQFKDRNCHPRFWGSTLHAGNQNRALYAYVQQTEN